MRKYSIIFDKQGMLECVEVIDREANQVKTYKRNPKRTELPLTDAIFVRAFYAFLDNGIGNAEDLYLDLLNSRDEYYLSLARKVYKKYLRDVIFKTLLHQHAIWSE